MKTCCMLISLGLLFALSMPAGAQGKLGEIRNELNRAEEEDKEESEKHHTHRTCPQPESGFFLGGLFFNDPPPRQRKRVYVETRYADGKVELEERYVDDGSPKILGPDLAYPAYPYPLGLAGYLQPDPTPVESITGNAGEVLDLKPWSLRLWIENGNDFDGLNRFAGGLFADAGILGIYTNWNYFYEDLPFGFYRDATLGNITLTLGFLRTKYLLMRVGVGAWLFDDGFGDESGVNTHFSFDVFPAEPWVVSALIEGGGIGPDSKIDVFHARVTVGYLFERFEIYGGYDYFEIGRTDLDGLLFGVRAWF